VSGTSNPEHLNGLQTIQITFSITTLRGGNGRSDAATAPREAGPNGFRTRKRQHQKRRSCKKRTDSRTGRRAREAPRGAGQPNSAIVVRVAVRNRARIEKSPRRDHWQTGISALMRDTRTESPKRCPRSRVSGGFPLQSKPHQNGEKEILCWFVTECKPPAHRVPRKVRDSGQGNH